MDFNDALVALGELNKLQEELDQLTAQRKKADADIRIKYNVQLQALATAS